MTHHVDDLDFESWEQEAGLHASLRAIRSDKPPAESVERFLARVTRIGSEPSAERLTTAKGERSAVAGSQQNTPSGQDTNADRTTKAARRSIAKTHSSRTHRYRLAAALAMVLVVMTSLSLTLFSSRSAWSQVVAGLGKHAWIRLTLQPPATPTTEAERTQAASIWLNGNRTIAAISSTQQNAWVDLVSGDQFQLMQGAPHVLVTKLQSSERNGITPLLESLAPFELKLGITIPDQVSIHQTARESVVIGGVPYTDYTFTYQPPDTLTSPHKVIVRVDQESQQPVQLTIRQAVFTIDYPEAGPTDIYSLGVSRQTPVTDLRHMEQYVENRTPPAYDDYEAIELAVLAGLEGQWINEAKRYRSSAGVVQMEAPSLDQVLSLAESTRAATSPPATPATSTSATPPAKHDTDWWFNQVSQLDFQTQEWSPYGFPHSRGYTPIGAPQDYRSAIASSLAGLEGTIELRAARRSVWLDPQRDFIVRRIETVAEDGSISVTQMDEMIQDSQGHWFVTRWRNGRVNERGGELAMTVDRESPNRVATVVFTAKIQFKHAKPQE